MMAMEDIKNFSSFRKAQIEIFEHPSESVSRTINVWHRKPKFSIVIERGHGGYMTLDKQRPKSLREIESELSFNPENLEPNSFYIDTLAEAPIIYRKTDDGLIEFYRVIEG